MGLWGQHQCSFLCVTDPTYILGNNRSAWVNTTATGHGFTSAVPTVAHSGLIPGLIHTGCVARPLPKIASTVSTRV